jgi:GntR family transcriptional regulator, rspAB operon transcriptional repressor
MASQSEPAPLIRNSVYERIRSEILSCALKPGSQIQERDLAERYAVSKSPIRDALLRLEAQNLIEVMPRKGYRVRPISVADAGELYEMRLVLERACITRLVETAADADLAGLDAFRQEPGGGDLALWIAYNRAFHIALADRCGNARLSRVTRDVLEQFDRLTLMSVTADESDSLARYVEEHGVIIDAVQRRDKRAAASLVRDHVENSRKRLLDRLANLSVVP